MRLNEFLIVFGIMGIISLSSLGFQRELPKFRLKSASFKLYSMFVDARNIAMRTGCYCGVVIEDRKDGHYITLVKDSNFNGVSYREYLSGKDREIGKGFVLEKKFPGVVLKKIAFSSKHVISFSPELSSSSGSLYLSTNDVQDGKIRLKIYGRAFVVKPIRIFADGSEVNYE